MKRLKLLDTSINIGAEKVARLPKIKGEAGIHAGAATIYGDRGIMASDQN